MTITEYQVSGMTCDHCEMSVREEVEQVAGVEKIAVSHKTGTLIITSSLSVDDAKVLAAVEEAGYSAVPARA